MTQYRVTAVRYQNQRLMALQLGEGEGPGQWVQEPHAVEVSVVVERIASGAIVRALLRADERVQDGPLLKVVAGEQGEPTLALDNAPSDCLELADLERF